MDIKSPQLGAIGLRLKRSLKPIVRHHLIISFVIVLGALIFAVFTVNSILTMPADQEYITKQQTEGIKTRFDEKTIQQIEELRRSDDRTALSLPGGRINPFSE